MHKVCGRAERHPLKCERPDETVTVPVVQVDGHGAPCTHARRRRAPTRRATLRKGLSEFRHPRVESGGARRFLIETSRRGADGAEETRAWLDLGREFESGANLRAGRSKTASKAVQ